MVEQIRCDWEFNREAGRNCHTVKILGAKVEYDQ